MAWYNTYRPKKFEEVTGQDLVKKILTNALNKNSVRHAYLFSGSKGVGKTTLARIFAHSLNKTDQTPESRIDIIEMDAASNTGIDDIRGIIESAKITPLSGDYKIFIIDEVHMLSKPAMNALLKILEEPPSYLVFLLATTNPEKLLPTIHSRLTLLKLHNHSDDQIISRLRYISSQESMTIDDEALKLIAKKSDGSQRDAINLLETLNSYGLESYSSADVAQILGLLDYDILELMHQQLIQIVSGNSPEWDELLSIISSQGIDPDTLLVQLTDYSIQKSFEGDSSLNSVIPHLVELQSKRYPFTSPVSLLGVLHAYIIPNERRGKSPDPTDTQPNLDSNKPSQTTNPNSFQPVPDTLTDIPGSSSNTNSNSSVGEDKPSSTSKQIDDPSTSVSKSKVQRSLQTLLSSKDCQPMLKMMAGDIVVDGIAGSVITISSTNGIFESQLKTKAMSNYITKYLEDHLGSKFTMEVVSRVKNTKNSDTAQEPATNSLASIEDDAMESSTTQMHDAYQSVSEIPEPEPPQPSKDAGETVAAGEVFYSVFKKLPEEIKHSGIPVFAGEVPDPEKHEDSARDEWDKHSEEMFEFE